MPLWRLTPRNLALRPPKTKASRRTITLPDVTAEALRRHRAKQAEERPALGLGKDDDALVFTVLDGGPIRPRNLTKDFSRIVKRVKGPADHFARAATALAHQVPDPHRLQREGVAASAPATPRSRSRCNSTATPSRTCRPRPRPRWTPC